MKKIFVSVILSVILGLPTYSACTVTGGACAIDDIIKIDKKTKNINKTKKKNKKATNKKNTVKNNHRTLLKSK